MHVSWSQQVGRGQCYHDLLFRSVAWTPCRGSVTLIGIPSEDDGLCLTAKLHERYVVLRTDCGSSTQKKCNDDGESWMIGEFVRSPFRGGCCSTIDIPFDIDQKSESNIDSDSLFLFVSLSVILRYRTARAEGFPGPSAMIWKPAAVPHVVATGFQSTEDRFGFGVVQTLFCCGTGWVLIRSLQTALSQVHNLYFVAYGENIYVYVPHFPTQTVSPQPVLILTTQPTNAQNPGYLDLQHAHAINNLLVQCLGTEEVIATVRDDGDVDVVLVRHIIQAVNRRSDSGNMIPTIADEIRPIFQSNVGISAWGLAIHTDSRIVACSSNHHEVRIFKFGLFTEDSKESGDQDDDSSFEREEDSISTFDRKMDVTLRVINGEANIPCIAFCNTGDDPDARWLLTTDVLGSCRVMDLHTFSSVHRFRFGRSSGAYGTIQGFDRLNAGWAIMFLDTRSFQKERRWRDALNISEGHDLPGASSTTSVVWDLSDTVNKMPGRSEAFTYHRQGARTHGESYTRSTTESDSAWPSESSPNDGVTGSAVLSDSSLSVGDEDGEEGHSAQRAQSRDSEPFSAQTSQTDDVAIEEQVDIVADDHDPDDEGTEDSMPFSSVYGGSRVFGNLVNFAQQNSICDDLPCPILHTSVRNIYLLQPSDQRNHIGPFSPPMIGMAGPLRQAVQVQYGALNMYDRLNMTACIPVLGTVILASQKGRVLVLSLTKISSHRESDLPSGMINKPHRTIYAMRCDCILPFASQEKLNQRPFAPLHGITVGPMQGTHNLPNERKRWRLMLMYQDHSILSYEICKRSEERRGSGVKPLVV
nr:putative wd repeat-containing protein c27b12.05 [Quercus suber]